MLKVAAGLYCLCSLGPGQTTAFDVSVVKPSAAVMGHDGVITSDPIRFSARNATLKRLIFEAYAIPYSRTVGGPAWVHEDEFDIDARTENTASREQQSLLLRALLADRFKLKVRDEAGERPVFILTVTKSGPKLAAPLTGDTRPWRFHGSLSQFADRLSVQLSIPIGNDPSVLTRASGTPVPVVDATGIGGTYDIAVDFRPDPGGDPFTSWQRVLQEQLGLRLEAARAPVVLLVIEHAEKPQANGN